MPEWGTALIIVATVIVVFLLMGYIKAPPDTAYIITGLGKRRILIGKAGIRLPFIERLDKLSLRVMQVDVKTSEAVPTNEFINVSVDGAGTIENMGIDNVEQIRKNAQIAKANAQRDIAIASSQAQEQANAVKVESEKKIAEQNAELSVQQAEMQIRADTKKAEADAAYSIQQENQRKTIEIAKADADIARREKEAEIAQAEIAVKEKQLDAEIRKQADAENYRIAKEAEAELIRRQKEADAKKYEATQEAAARRAQAEAIRYAMEQEAEGVKAKGLAEALAIEKKAEAQKRMGEASVIEMYLQALPEIVKNAADPLAQTDKIVMYGDGNATKLVKDVMHSANQVVDGVKEATGIDLAALIAGIGGGKLAAAAAKPAEKAQNPQAEAAEEAAIADAENNK